MRKSATAAATESKSTVIPIPTAAPSAMKVESFEKGKVELIEVKLNRGNKAIGIKLSELRKITNSSILICAVSRGEDVIIPSGDFMLEEEDHLYITGTHKDLSAFCLDIGVYKDKIKNVIIVGGSRIAYYLARQLSVQGIKVKIIEQNHERCLDLAQRFPYATIIEGDGSDEEILLEEIKNGEADYQFVEIMACPPAWYKCLLPLHKR